MQPGGELRPARLPARGMGPDTQKHFLRDFLGIGLIAQHTAGKRNHAPEMTIYKQTASCFVTLSHTGYQFIV